MTMRIGGHVSAAGGIDKAIDRALEIGANCFQIFIAPPQSWRKTTISDEQVAAFKAGVEAHHLGPVFIHALYLVNLATDRPELREKTVDALAYALETADRIGAQGVIYHTGSRKERDQDEALADVVGVMTEVLRKAPGTSQLIIENAAGHGGTLGDAFSELGAMVKAVQSPRVKVCLDTCHAFAAGYDVRTEAGVAAMMAEFEQEVGSEHLVVVHANDSKFDLNQGKDRHENIGEGFIGAKGFGAMLRTRTLRELPWILEVPGFDDEGPDARNVEILQQLAA